MITFQLEKYADCIAEIDALLPLHYTEIANDKEIIPLDKNHTAYEELDKIGQLHIVTVRLDGKIIGYHASIVRPHLHYKSTLCAFNDVYFLLPEYRKSKIGIQMFEKVEETLKARGVVKVFTGTKCKHDHSKMFELMGWTRVEYLYAKVLKENE